MTRRSKWELILSASDRLAEGLSSLIAAADRGLFFGVSGTFGEMSTTLLASPYCHKPLA